MLETETTGPKRLLVCEDDGAMRNWLRHVLHARGFLISEGASGFDLLSSLAGNSSVDAVVTDVRMPGPDGLRCVERLRASGGLVPVVVITAFPDDSVREVAARMAGVRLLAKPFLARQLTECLDDLLKDGAPCRQAAPRLVRCRTCGDLHIPFHAPILEEDSEPSFCPSCLERPIHYGDVFADWETLGGGD